MAYTAACVRYTRALCRITVLRLYARVRAALHVLGLCGPHDPQAAGGLVTPGAEFGRALGPFPGACRPGELIPLVRDQAKHLPGGAQRARARGIVASLGSRFGAYLRPWLTYTGLCQT